MPRGQNVRGLLMKHTFDRLLLLVRAQFFRFFSAALTLVMYAYFWIYHPEHIRSWSRGVRKLIEQGSELLPYPWDARIEPILIVFTPWAQITLAVIMVRIALATPFVIARMTPRRGAARR